MCKSILKGQNVPGTDGTHHGTDGTCPRDRRDAHQGVSRQNSLCLLVFFFPQLISEVRVYSVHPHTRQIYEQKADASFSAYFFGFLERQKQHILAISREKREKGRNKKDDQNWSCLFGSKSALFPQF